jgi:hypothetical protein
MSFLTVHRTFIQGVRKKHEQKLSRSCNFTFLYIDDVILLHISTLTASDKVYQLLAHGRWFSPASSTTKTGRYDIAEILLKVALNSKHQSINHHQSNPSSLK